MIDNNLDVIFIGESWLGSCARSLKEAIGRKRGIHLDEISEDNWFPRSRRKWVRAVHRVLRPVYRADFGAEVLAKIELYRPDVMMVYKGFALSADLILAIRQLGVFTVNVYPDNSPHAYGSRHRNAVGTYDLVISTKEYHPALWRELYGYENDCRFVPQGYDPKLHLVDNPPSRFDYDIAMVATYRKEYEKLLIELAKKLNDKNLRVVIGGNGWNIARAVLPAHWIFPGAVQGQGYISLLRSGKICIAPLTPEVVIDGQQQPGDVDTTRSYELAAAHCFFIHRRTTFISQIYDSTEVPMFDDATELAQHIRYYLEHDEERCHMAAAAHRRAVPAYSLDARASQIVTILEESLRQGKVDGIL